MRTLRTVKGDIKLDNKKHDGIAKDLLNVDLLTLTTTKRCFIIIILALLISSTVRARLAGPQE